jgi:hypothetical protein
MRTSLLGRAALLAAALAGGAGASTLAGCGAAPRPGPTAEAAAARVDLARITEPAILVQALRLDGAARDAALGPHAREVSVETATTPPGAPKETLAVRDRLDSDGKGGFHVVRELTRTVEEELAAGTQPRPSEQGMEAVVVGNELAVRPRWGKLARRRPEPGEAARLRALVETEAAGLLEVVAHAAAITRGAESTVDGRRALTLLVGKAAAPSTPTVADDSPGKAWRKSVVVEALSGTLTLDAASGAPLGAQIDARYRFTRDGKTFTVAARHAERLVAAQPVALPADAVASPERPRPMLDRQALLDGLTGVK